MSSKHYRLLTVSLFAVLIFLTGGIASAQSWYDSAWLSRQEITIDSDNAAYGLSGNLTDFPYLVKLTSAANDIFGKAQSDGDDILFTASDGVTKLAHELELYDDGGGTEELTAWVRLPSFAFNADTTIYMYYGNPNVAIQEQPQEVWGDNYAGVWHLGEDGGVSEYQDSTKNDITGVGGSISSTEAPTRSTNSVSGYSQDFPNAEDRIELGTLDIPGEALTLSGWFNHDSADPGDDNRIITKANGYSGSSVYWELGIGNGTNMRFRVQTGGVESDHTAGTITDDTWQYGTGVYDGTNMYLYLNGNLLNSWSKTGSINTNAGIGVEIGNTPPGVRSFHGLLDETRASNVARSADWIKTQYNMQLPANQGAPVNVSGQPDTVDTGKFIKKKGRQQDYYQYRKLITINKNKVEGTHTDFPVLVNLTLDPAKVQNANGYDIIFTNEYGEKLDHEIESYNNGTGEIFAWVKVSTLSSLKDTKIYIYYGNSSITTDPSSTAVWDGNYVGVWHLNRSFQRISK